MKVGEIIKKRRWSTWRQKKPPKVLSSLILILQSFESVCTAAGSQMPCFAALPQVLIFKSTGKRTKPDILVYRSTHAKIICSHWHLTNTTFGKWRQHEIYYCFDKRALMFLKDFSVAAESKSKKHNNYESI